MSDVTRLDDHRPELKRTGPPPPEDGKIAMDSAYAVRLSDALIKHGVIAPASVLIAASYDLLEAD